MSLLAVASGGALGAVARYLASGWVQDWTRGFFPWGTLFVNVAGCVLLGFAVTWLQNSLSSTEVQEVVTVGFLASFTTFSTFSFEAFAMLRDGELVAARIATSRRLWIAGAIVGLALAGSISNWSSFPHPTVFIVGQVVGYPVMFLTAAALLRNRVPR